MKEDLFVILFLIGAGIAFYGLIELFVEVNRCISIWMGLM